MADFVKRFRIASGPADKMFLRPVLTKARPLHRCFSTVDASEIKKFSEKAAEWWDPDGEFGMLQIMNPARVSYVRKQLGVDPESSKPFQGLNMLDIGCGGGFLSEVNGIRNEARRIYCANI